MNGGDRVRALTSGDVAWMADVMAERRARYQEYSPVFWRPAAHARDVHAPYLASCVASARFVGYRTTEGFILGERQSSIGFIDDFAVVRDDAWISDGLQLLVAAWSQLRDEGAESLRVVTARRDDAKVLMLKSAGLSVGESWWVRPGDDRAQDAQIFGPVAAAGIEALVIPAPPVYDPGGPVLLVTSIDSADRVVEVPLLAEEQGAVLAILPCPPISDLSRAAQEAGFDETTQYYVGQLHA